MAWWQSPALALALLAGSLLGTAVMGRWFTRRLQGFTGDCLGAAQQVVDSSDPINWTSVTATDRILAQLVVGAMLDVHGPRRVFMAAAGVQVVFFALMPGLYEGCTAPNSADGLPATKSPTNWPGAL